MRKAAMFMTTTENSDQRHSDGRVRDALLVARP
jgi:hypothetical protein